MKLQETNDCALPLEKTAQQGIAFLDIQYIDISQN